MDAFEQVMAGILFQEGYWVSQSFKVELTKEEKREIGRASSPRWEIDLLAYKADSNELLAVECKSYLDSTGVQAKHILEWDGGSSRYKLFVDAGLREVVFRRLSIQLVQLGLIPANTWPRLALAAGKMRNAEDLKLLKCHFEKMDWLLYDPEWISDRLLSSAKASYFDSVTHVVSKILTRNCRQGQGEAGS